MNQISRSCAVGLLLSSLLLSGCGSPSKNPLNGQWGIASADRLMRKIGASPSEIAVPVLDDGNDELDQDHTEDRPKMILEFFPSGKLITTTLMGRFDPPPKEGTWQQISFDQTKQVMIISCTLGTQVTEHEVLFIEPDLIELIPPNLAGTNQKIKFLRLRP